MKKTLLATLLALSAITAQAADKGFVTLEYEHEGIHGSNTNVNSFNILPGVKLDNGFTIDLKTQIQTKTGEQTTSANLEPRVRYDYDLGPVSVWGRLGVGEKFADADHFAYYTVEPGVTLRLTSAASVFVSDRYRDSFSDGKGYQTNTVYVGGSYAVTNADTVAVKAYRKYQDTESNGLEVAYTRWF